MIEPGHKGFHALLDILDGVELIATKDIPAIPPQIGEARTIVYQLYEEWAQLAQARDDALAQRDTLRGGVRND